MPIKLAFDDSLDWDVAVSDSRIQMDEGLFSSVAESLLTDGYATPDELAEAGLPRDMATGWWGDAYAETDGDKVGSKLWLLKRAKWTATTLARGKQWADDALAWMLEDGVARTVTVTTWRMSFGHMGMRTEITKPDGTRWSARWAYALGDGANAVVVE